MIDLAELKQKVIDGEQEAAVELTKRAIATGCAPDTVFNEALLPAMEEVGRRMQAQVFSRPLARHVPLNSPLATWLARAEHRIKGPLFGCQVCGFCRLPDTFYVCPETCPKGLANGPCGGSTGNLCEAGDRECVHSVRYRIAKASGRLDQLARTLIPPVPEPRGGSSWLTHYAGRAPR